MQNGRFLSKIALLLNKVCYRVSLCEYCQRQSFTGLSIHAKMVGGERTFEGKFSSLSEPVSARANVRDADKQ